MINEIDHRNWSRFGDFINKSDKIVVIPHLNPDGDAIGAALAMNRILKNEGKDVQVLIPSSFPDFLRFLIGAKEVIDFEKEKKKATAVIDESDLIIFVDFNELKRTKDLEKALAEYNGSTIMIDHHPFPKMNCDLMISETSVSSTCELVYRVIEASGLKHLCDKGAAEAIFTGIMTDTGNFGYNSSNPETFRVVGELLSHGIDKDRLYSNVYHNFSHDRWKLLGHCLVNKMVVLNEYKTAFIALSKKDLEQFNFQQGDSEGFVNYPLNIKGIVFSALFMEKDDLVKVSLRSKGSFPTNEFSRNHFNGGGHTNAAGGESLTSLEETIEEFIAQLPNYIDKLNHSF